MANIFARGSRERAPIALLAKCELPQSTLCFAFSIRHESPKRKNHAVWRGSGMKRVGEFRLWRIFLLAAHVSELPSRPNHA
jgi:hypothetical protein